MTTEMVNEATETVNSAAGDGQVVEDGGDSQVTSVTDETVNDDKVVPLSTLKTIEKKYKSEKEAREYSDRQIAELRAELGYIRQHLQGKPAEEKDEYEPVTYGELKQHEAKIEQKLRQQMVLKNIEESTARARAKYGNDEFEENLRIFRSNALSQAEKEAILGSNDPGEYMMRYVNSLHKSGSKGSKDTAKEIAEKMTQNTSQIKTLSATSKANSKSLNKIAEIDRMTPAEVGRMLDEKIRKKGG